MGHYSLPLSLLLLYMQQAEYTDRLLVADDVPRGRYRALVVAFLELWRHTCCASASCCRRSFSDGKNHRTTPADAVNTDAIWGCSCRMAS